MLCPSEKIKCHLPRAGATVQSTKNVYFMYQTLISLHAGCHFIRSAMAANRNLEIQNNVILDYNIYMKITNSSDL